MVNSNPDDEKLTASRAEVDAIEAAMREAALFFLSLAFEPDYLQRIHELAVKNQDGALAADEAEALRNYRQVGLQIDVLARRLVKSSSGGRFPRVVAWRGTH